MTTSDAEEAIRKFKVANKRDPDFGELAEAVMCLTKQSVDVSDLRDRLDMLQSVGRVRQVNGFYGIV